MCVLGLNGQKPLSKDLFVGSWFYQGPQRPDLNDTIWLMKTLPGEQSPDYIEWEFMESHNIIETMVKSINQDKNRKIEMRVASPEEYTWDFDNTTNHLSIQKYKEEPVYSVIEYKQQIITLIKIK